MAEGIANKAPGTKAAGNRAGGGRRRAPFLTVRHYCQGIGDAHLLTLTGPGGRPFRMLIDCGVHSAIKGGNDLMRAIAADLAAEAGRLDVVVVTHEHWDHVSGFLAAAETFAGIEIGEVWMPWTEDPQDADARALDRYRQQALAALQLAGQALAAQPPGPEAAGFGLAERLGALLGFQFGAVGERVRAARDAAAALAPEGGLRYLDPAAGPFTPAGLDGVRIHVLGPPRSREALRLEERAGEMYGFAGAAAEAMAANLERGLAAGGLATGGGTGWQDPALPFDPDLGEDLSAALAGGGEAGTAGFLGRHYLGEGEDAGWRRIDGDWLGIAADLALQLDRGVNNTSLVLAFEDLRSGRVFLFPGDAQIGSWLSWQDLDWQVDGATISARDLLARTVYLKVAHHGSHNATPRRNGLELMADPDLAAFVPVNEADAQRIGWKRMPFPAILSALAERGDGRVLRADDPPDAVDPLPSGAIRALRRGQAQGPGGVACPWVEVDLS